MCAWFDCFVYEQFCACLRECFRLTHAHTQHTHTHTHTQLNSDLIGDYECDGELAFTDSIDQYIEVDDAGNETLGPLTFMGLTGAWLAVFV